MKVSIIIPIYNAEKYLSRCLDSILAIKSVDWECILIDDGSTDNSWDIICQYTGKSNRFIARHKENGGVSSARNLGLKICSEGSKIMFVDPDDYLLPEADKLLYQAVTQYADYDMVLFRWVDVYPEGAKNYEIPITDFKNQNDWIKKTVLFTPTMDICWSRLFEQSVIFENNIWFDTSMRLAEDTYFVAEYLKYCNTIAVIWEGLLYAYCLNKDSAKGKFYKKDIYDELRAHEKKLELVANRKLSIIQQEKQKINSSFFNVINIYAYGCAKHCSRREFKNVMRHLFENEKLSKIICNCYNDSDTFKIKLIKLLIRNKLFGMYWYVLTLKKMYKDLKYKKRRTACHIKI